MFTIDRTVPGLEPSSAGHLVERLQERLVALLDLGLTLKHVHWNVAGPNFISVHELLDTHHRAVSVMADAVAERMATLGGEPSGVPGAIITGRSWNDYDVGRADALTHLERLDDVYTGVITSHRDVWRACGDIDPVTSDLLLGQIGQLEQIQWFVRSHLARLDHRSAGADRSREPIVDQTIDQKELVGW